MNVCVCMYVCMHICMHACNVRMHTVSRLKCRQNSNPFIYNITQHKKYIILITLVTVDTVDMYSMYVCMYLMISRNYTVDIILYGDENCSLV